MASAILPLALGPSGVVDVLRADRHGDRRDRPPTHCTMHDLSAPNATGSQSLPSDSALPPMRWRRSRPAASDATLHLPESPVSPTDFLRAAAEPDEAPWPADMPARRRAPAHRVHQHRERDRALAVRLINEYKATEDALKASGLDYTILRNGYYLDIPPDTMAEELRGQMSPPEIELMLGIATSIRHGEADCPTADLETLIGRAPTGLDEFLVYAAPAA